MSHVNVAAVVDFVVKEVVQYGKPVEEVIDALIDTSSADLHLAILDEYSRVDLSEPPPALAMGWDRVRGQLAYNALSHAVSGRLRSR